MPYPAYDHYLTNKARAAWRHAVVIREQDGSFVLLKRDATPPVVLSPYIGEDRGPYATFHAARKRLYELRDAAKVSSRKLGNMG